MTSNWFTSDTIKKRNETLVYKFVYVSEYVMLLGVSRADINLP